MKKLLLLFFLFFLPIKVFTLEEVDVILFYGESCPHCEAEMEFLESIEEKYNLNIIKYEVWGSSENMELLREALEVRDYSYMGVPVTIVGEKLFVGYGDYSAKDIEKAISNCYDEKCVYDSTETKLNETITIPILGEIDPKKASLPIITIVMGAVDGFNPCAMWVLLFLISMLLSLDSNLKKWILGLTFIFFSAATYFVFMASWLNLIFLISSVVIIRVIVGLLASGAGVFNIYKYIKIKDDGCDVVPIEKRKPIFDKIKKVLKSKNFLWALLGMIVIAVSVNVVELACSLGLPVVYTQILSMSGISKGGYYLYLLLYNFFFMLDDIIIFTIAMFFLKITGVSTKYTKYSHLIGGILMFIIGVLLVFYPEILMFG